MGGGTAARARAAARSVGRVSRSTLDVGICETHAHRPSLVMVFVPPRALPLWWPYRVGDYWQCATPTGPYNFQAPDELSAIGICERERASVAA